MHMNVLSTRMYVNHTTTWKPAEMFNVNFISQSESIFHISELKFYYYKM